MHWGKKKTASELTVIFRYTIESTASMILSITRLKKISLIASGAESFVFLPYAALSNIFALFRCIQHLQRCTWALLMFEPSKTVSIQSLESHRQWSFVHSQRRTIAIHVTEDVSLESTTDKMGMNERYRCRHRSHPKLLLKQGTTTVFILSFIHNYLDIFLRHEVTFSST
jgi:hypothetical protein